MTPRNLFDGRFDVLKAIFLTPLLVLNRIRFSVRSDLVDSIPDLLLIIIENYFVLLAIGALTDRRGRLSKVFAAFLLLLHVLIVAADTVLFSYVGTPLNPGLMLAVLGKSNGVEATQELRAAQLVFFATLLTEILIIYGLEFRTKRNGSYMILPLAVSKPSVIAAARKRLALVFSLWVTLHLMLLDAYSPGYQFMCTSVASIELSMQGSSTFTEKAHKVSTESKPNKKRPNVLLILNESLGNQYYRFLQQENGGNALFYQKQVSESHNITKDGFSMFEFLDVKPVSGMTDTATTSIITGTILASDLKSPAEERYFDYPTITRVAKSLGYNTSLFCSYDTHYNSRWSHMNFIFDQFDHVVSRTTLGVKAVNEYGMDDRVLTNMLSEDLAKRSPDTPWFTLVIWNNAHHPFLVDAETFKEPKDATGFEKDKARYLDTIRMTDRMVRQVMGTLKRNEQEQDTIVAFTSDHGETPGAIFSRTSVPDERTLSVPLWYQIPNDHISAEQKRILELNLKRVVSNLDVLPTLAELMGVSMKNLSNEEQFPLITGRSLLQPIPENRVVIGFQGRPFVSGCESTAGFLANKTHMMLIWPYKHQITLRNITESAPWSSMSSMVLESGEFNDWINLLEQKFPEVTRQFRICGLQSQFRDVNDREKIYLHELQI